MPRFLELDAVNDGSDPNPRAILSHCWLAPDAVRLAGPDEVVVLGWEHASATPPDWELGDAIRSWAETGDGGFDPTPSRALLAVYRRTFDGPLRLELAMFTSSVAALLNWTATRVGIALDGCDPERRELAQRNLPGLLANPITLAKLERLIADVDR